MINVILHFQLVVQQSTHPPPLVYAELSQDQLTFLRKHQFQAYAKHGDIQLTVALPLLILELPRQILSHRYYQTPLVLI